MSGNSKKAVVSGYYGFDNFGDEAILKVIVSNLKKNNIDVCVISKNPDKTAKNLDVESVYTFAVSKIIKNLRVSDVLISGGGSLLQDVTSLKSLFYYLFIIFCAIALRKKVIIFAQGIGPINNIIGRLTAGEPVKMERVGVQLRSWKNLSGKYLAALAAQVAKNFSDKEIYIYSFQDALDLDICKKFEMNLKIADDTLKTRIVSAVGVDEIVQSVSNLEYMIAMRYHACLLALKYGVKTMALSYDEKVQKLANRFGIPCSDLADIEKLPDYFEKLKTLDAKKIQTETENLDFDFSEILSVIKH